MKHPTMQVAIVADEIGEHVVNLQASFDPPVIMQGLALACVHACEHQKDPKAAWDLFKKTGDEALGKGLGKGR